MPLQPSRRDFIGPPPRDVSDLSRLVMHGRSAGRSIEQGLQDGRFATLRPVGQHGTPEIVGGSGEGDDTQYEWEWGDRLTVTALGTQSFRLTYEPVEESLVIRWHPDGKGPITQVNERWSLDGQIVTIPDPGGDIAVGDMFSAQYQYEPTEIVDGALTLVGTGTAYATNPTLALPAGSQVGDFIVITTITGTISDGRVSLLAGHDGTGLAHFYTYAGTLTSLGGFATTGGSVLATWAVFRAPTVISTPATQTGPGSTGPATTTVTTPHAILAVGVRGGLTDASLSVPVGYTLAVNNGLLVHARSAIAYWDSAAGEASPNTAITGTFDDYMVNVIGVTNEDADN
jgi:hypothetical protein